MKRKKKEQEHSGKLTPEKEPGGPFLLVLGNLLYPKPSPLISLFFFLVFFLSALSVKLPSVTSLETLVLSPALNIQLAPRECLSKLSKNLPSCNSPEAPFSQLSSSPILLCSSPRKASPLTEKDPLKISLSRPEEGSMQLAKRSAAFADYLDTCHLLIGFLIPLT